MKIFLGALITRTITYNISKTNNHYESKKVILDQSVKLIREHALHIEHIECKLNDCIIESQASSFKVTKSILVSACNEAHAAKSMTNLLSTQARPHFTRTLFNRFNLCVYYPYKAFKRPLKIKVNLELAMKCIRAIGKHLIVTSSQYLRSYHFMNRKCFVSTCTEMVDAQYGDFKIQVDGK